VRAGWIAHTRVHTAVRITHERAPLRIHGLVHKVEQIAIVRRAHASRRPQVANRAALDWIIRSCVHRGPRRPSIKRRSDIKVPRRTLVEAGLVGIVARHRCAEERIRRPVIITARDFRKG